MDKLTGGRQCESNELDLANDCNLQKAQTATTAQTANTERIPYTGVQQDQLRGYVNRECGGCHATFRIRASELKRGGGRGQFCSRSCRPEGNSDTATRRRAREIWIARNGGAHPICRLCARKADIHHKDGDPLNNAPKNQDRLCRSHHTSLENYAKYMGVLKATQTRLAFA